MKRSMKWEVVGLSLLIGSIGPAFAGVDEMAKTCNACHGNQGISSHTDIPTIAGIAESNLAEQMRSYLDGRPAKTVNHVTGDTSKQGNMTDIVKGLSDDQIDELAAYYAELPYQPMKQPFDAALAKAGQKLHEESGCKKCHSEGGSVADDEASILSGQPKGYILMALQEFKAGKRSNDEKMNNAIIAMSDADLQALAEYYASQQ
ncbi:MULTISPECIES: periplasmic diheme shuttle PdsA [Aeromonas]|uniref:periplasmic diheme shuttle PdsA n=2 Tax=Aeromonadaceae TaxID=84642 RepID=UPI001C24D21E|nr:MULTISPECIES: c-type cytochrome [Aeromonas]QWZ82027.1 c-type cytochrome [Aeromonas sp. FDAARGOS 1414]UDN24336.1 c-type cytochrome [Aeromonas veronii]